MPRTPDGRRRGVACGLACALYTLAQVPLVAAPQVRGPDGATPPILDGLSLPADLQALAVSPDGRRAALAVPVAAEAERGRERIEVRVHGADGSVVAIPVGGTVRDLLFLDAERLYAVEHRPMKRGEGETTLVRLDLGSQRVERLIRLPASARGLEYWPHGDALLIPAQDEIRTLTLPLLRSGPLYRVLGQNLCVAAAGGTRIVVGQDSALLVVDLADPQQREEMPVRARVAVPVPVVSLALTADGVSGVAALSDGRVLALRIDPLALDEDGTGLALDPRAVSEPPPGPAVAADGPPGAATPFGAIPEAPPAHEPALAPDPHGIDAAQPAEPPASDSVATGGPAAAAPSEPPAATPSATLLEVGAPPAANEPSPIEAHQEIGDAAPGEAVEPGGEPTAEPAPPQPPAAAPRRSPEPAEQPVPETTLAAPARDPEPGPAADTPRVEPPAPAPGAAPPRAGATIHGTISGSGAARVVAVLALGPDNLLREAARVRPAADGRYALAGLAPGRYTIQIDGGSGRILVVEPPYRVIDLAASGGAVADFRVAGEP